MVGVLFKIPGGASFLCCISPSRLTLNGMLSVEYNVLFNKRYFVACAASIEHGCLTSRMNDVATHQTSLHRHTQTEWALERVRFSI